MDGTINEWLKQLPEPQQTEAIDNVVAQNRANLAKRTSSLPVAISSGFMWFKTEQGLEYWQEVHDRAMRGEFIPPAL